MPEIQNDDIKDAYSFAMQLAKDAGQILLKGLDERRTAGLNSHVHVEELAHVEKANAVDIVTQTDNGMHGRRVMDIVTDSRRRRGVHSREDHVQISKPWVYRRGIIFQRVIPHLQHLTDDAHVGSRSTGWHSQLHACLSHVLCLYSARLQRKGHCWRHLRSPTESAVLGLQGRWCMVERDYKSSTDPRKTLSERQSLQMRVLMRVG